MTFEEKARVMSEDRARFIRTLYEEIPGEFQVQVHTWEGCLRHLGIDTPLTFTATFSSELAALRCFHTFRTTVGILLLKDRDKWLVTNAYQK
jgi:hypothetical protein